MVQKLIMVGIRGFTITKLVQRHLGIKGWLHCKVTETTLEGQECGNDMVQKLIMVGIRWLNN